MTNPLPGLRPQPKDMLTQSHEDTKEMMSTDVRHTMVLLLGILVCPGLADDVDSETLVRYEQSVTVSATVLKSECEGDERVSLTVTVKNNDSNPIYLHAHTPGVFTGHVTMTDANGVVVMGDAIPTPPAPPAHYYMERDSRRTFLVPVSQVGGFGEVSLVKPDAIDIYRRHLSEGTYELDPGYVETLHDVSNVIVRNDVPHALWIEPSSHKVSVRHKLNRLKIEIRGKLQAEALRDVMPGVEPKPETVVSQVSQPLANSHGQTPGVMSWMCRISTIVVATIAGIGVLSAIVLSWR